MYAMIIWVCTYTKKAFTPAISTKDTLGDYVDFALLQILLSLFWYDRSVLKSCVIRKAACKYSFVLLNFSRNGHLCLTTWERSMSQMQTHASKNPGTPSQAAGIHRLQICKGKQCEPIQLRWQQGYQNSLYTMVLLRSGDYLTRPCLWNCSSQENVGWL